MPFNKGDFTQQGVAGHVNANLRLNEKRLVNIDLTSNEAAEGCTINGTVKDLLNNKVYGVGSGVSGNIEITENGENINVAPYATATVNVAGGGGDSLKKTVLTVNNTDIVSRSVSDAFPNAINYFVFGDIIEGQPHMPTYNIRNNMVDIGSILNISVEPSGTLVLDLYYCYRTGYPNVQALTSANDIATAVTNMTYDSQYGEYDVTDYTQDSALTVDLIDAPK